MFWSAENPTYVFPAYKYALGTNEITGYNDCNVAVSFVTQDVTALTNKYYWTRDCASPFLRYSAFWFVPDKAIQFADSYLMNVADGSVNKDTDASATTTYQHMTNTEPEYYLFNANVKGREKYISACPMIKDLDYDVNAFNEVVYIKGSKGIKGQTLGRKAKYLTKEYNLSGIYDQELYRTLNMPEDNIIEDLAFKRPGESFEFRDRDDLIEKRVKDYIKIDKLVSVKGQKGYKGVKGYKGKKGYVNPYDHTYYSGRILEFGVRGFILSYTDDEHVGGGMIPMTYYEFPNTIYSNMDYIKINWNTNGFIEVK